MKVNPTDASLALILHSLDHAILPEEGIPPGARAQLDFIRMVVNDLLKRQGPSVPLLQSRVDEGVAVKKALLAALGEDEEEEEEEEETQTTDRGSSFDSLAALQGRLTEDITLLCARLSAKQPDREITAALLRRASEWELQYYVGLSGVKARPFGDDPDSPPTPAPTLSRAFLQAFLAGRRGGSALKVTALSRNPGGYGKQTYFATVEHANGSVEELVVRKNDAAPFLTFKQFRIDQEFELLKALRGAGYPAPTPVDLGVDLPGIDGPFFTMERLRGKMVSSFMDGLSNKIDDAVWLQLAALLAKLHSIPLTAFSNYITKYDEAAVLHSTMSDWYRKSLKEWRQYSTDVQILSSPSIHWLFNWLERNIPDDQRRPVLIHGDFNIHNVLAEDNTISGILDWETSTFGAPEQDLAWIQPHVSRQFDWDDFLEQYKKSGGREVNTANLPFYLGFMVMQLQIGMSHANYNLQAGENRDIRFVMCEQAFTAYLISTGLSCTAAIAATGDSPTLESTASVANGSVGADDDDDDVVLLSKGGQEDSSRSRSVATATNGMRGDISGATAAQKMKFTPGDKVKIHDQKELEIRGDDTHVRQKPGPEPHWQDSVVLVWWDEETSTGGFHRIGHEPNIEEGGKVLIWNNIFTPNGIYVHAAYNPLRESDQPSNGGFGGGDDTAEYHFDGGEHIWTTNDTEISARLAFTDTGPNLDCFPKRGTLSAEFAPAHFDIPGTVTGWVKFKGHEYQVQALGLRDHGWGTRDWSSLLSHRWVAGSCGAALGFVAVAFHTVDDQLVSFGWIVRGGAIIFAKSVDILAYFEIDSVTNRGGRVTFELTTGETVQIEATPVAKAVVSYSRDVYCVDRMCSVSCSSSSSNGPLRGICDFETTSNFQQGHRRQASKFVSSVIGNGFHES